MAELKKVLSFPAILLITINSIMGTGIFFLPAVGAGAAGPASILSWLFLSLISIYIAMCFGELSSMFPKAGGIYEYCKQAYGRFISFIIGWMTIMAGNITIAMLVVGAIQYLLPVGSPLMKIGISLIFIFAFNYIAFKGTPNLFSQIQKSIRPCRGEVVVVARWLVHVSLACCSTALEDGCYVRI